MSHIKYGKAGYGLALGLILCVIANPTFAEDDTKAKPKDASISSSEHHLMAEDTTIVDPNTLVDPNDLPCPRISNTSVVWSKFPKNDTILSYYPRFAYTQRISGRVRIACSWESDGRITDCQILSETPKKYGFGVSTAKFIIDQETVVSIDKTRYLEAGTGICTTVNWVLK